MGCAGGAKPTHFIVVGERNSGTNYLHRLISANLDIPPASVPGTDVPPFWKHELWSTDLESAIHAWGERWRRDHHAASSGANAAADNPEADDHGGEEPTVLLLQVTKNP